MKPKWIFAVALALGVTACQSKLDAAPPLDTETFMAQVFYTGQLIRCEKKFLTPAQGEYVQRLDEYGAQQYLTAIAYARPETAECVSRALSDCEGLHPGKCLAQPSVSSKAELR